MGVGTFHNRGFCIYGVLNDWVALEREGTLRRGLLRGFGWHSLDVRLLLR